MLGRMCHQESTYPHRCARGMVVSTELGRCTCLFAHQSELKQVGALHDLAVTCASCETSSLFWCCGIRGWAHEAVVRMHGLDGAFHWVVQASRNNWPSASLRGTMCMHVYSLRSAIHAAWFQERIVRHAWEN